MGEECPKPEATCVVPHPPRLERGILPVVGEDEETPALREMHHRLRENVHIGHSHGTNGARGLPITTMHSAAGSLATYATVELALAPLTVTDYLDGHQGSHPRASTACIRVLFLQAAAALADP